jgi:hypothetical protein
VVNLSRFRPLNLRSESAAFVFLVQMRRSGFLDLEPLFYKLRQGFTKGRMDFPFEGADRHRRWLHRAWFVGFPLSSKGLIGASIYAKTAASSFPPCRRLIGRLDESGDGHSWISPLNGLIGRRQLCARLRVVEFPPFLTGLIEI